MKKGRVIDAAVTADEGDFLEIPSFVCHIKEDPTEGLCTCGEPITELGCLEHGSDSSAGVDVSDILDLEDDL